MEQLQVEWSRQKGAGTGRVDHLETGTGCRKEQTKEQLQVEWSRQRE
jgi:hypothetical protein